MINYIEKGIGLHQAINAAGHWLAQRDDAWVSSDDEAVQAIIDAYDFVGALRQDVLDKIKTERTVRQAMGLSYAFPDGTTGTIQTRNEQDLLNINGQVTAAIVLQSQGIDAPVLSFRDEQNVTHPLTAMQMIEMGMAASQFVSTVYAAKWAHDEAVKLWDGEGDYDYLTGWPAV